MPLIILTGYPSSGKTRRALELEPYFRKQYPDKRLVVVTDNETDGFNREDIYSNPGREKNLRAHLKSETQKSLDKNTLVILDSLAYIKGYRYELYCVTKSAQTPHCIIWCDVSQERSRELNSRREQRYSDILLGELFMRYEQPNSQNRWDSPLFIVHPEDELPLEQIDAALWKSKAPPPNASTVAQPLQPTNFLYELDRVTNEIVKHIVSGQRTSVLGESIKIPQADDIQLVRNFTLAELNKIRRQFITYMKMNPIGDINKLPNMFVTYLRNSLSQ